jgi:hypothetical protein
MMQIIILEKLGKKLVNVKNVGITLHVQKTRGAINNGLRSYPKNLMPVMRPKGRQAA